MPICILMREREKGLKSREDLGEVGGKETNQNKLCKEGEIIYSK